MRKLCVSQVGNLFDALEPDWGAGANSLLFTNQTQKTIKEKLL